MNLTVAKIAWIARGLLAFYILYVSALFAVAIGGGLMWGSGMSPLAASSLAWSYASLSVAAVGYVFFGSKDWLRWVVLLLPLAPILVARA